MTLKTRSANLKKNDSAVASCHYRRRHVKHGNAPPAKEPLTGLARCCSKGSRLKNAERTASGSEIFLRRSKRLKKPYNSSSAQRRKRRPPRPSIRLRKPETAW